MRWALLVLIALAACHRPGAPSAAQIYDEARNLLRREQYAAAWAKAAPGLEQTKPGSYWHWKFRLLKIEILLGQREGVKAQKELESLRLPSGPEWTADRGRYCLYQAHAAFLQNQYAEARARLAEARALAEAAGSAGLAAEIELRAAFVSVLEGRFGEAEAGFRQVLDAASRQGDTYLRLRAAGGMGYLLLNSFRYDEAIPWFEETLTQARRLGAADSEARAMGNLGSCYQHLGDLDKAVQYFQQAEARFTGAQNRFERQIWLGNLGNIAFYRRERASAAAYYTRALEIARDLKDRNSMGNWLYNLAKNAIGAEDWAAAERYNNEAWAIWRDLADKASELYAVANAGWIAAGKKDYAQAEKLFLPVVRSRSEDPELLLDAHAGLSHTLALAGRDADAEAQFRATDALIERFRSELLKDEYKLTYFSSTIDFYQEYVEFLMARGKTRTGLAAAESSRARVLADRLKLSGRRGRNTAAEFQQIARASGSTLLSYWLGPKKSYLWVVTPAAVAAFGLPPAPQIRNLVESYDRLIQRVRDPLQTESAAARTLYGTLLGPARGLLANTHRIILAPDGPLYALNFEAIPVFDGAPHYWIRDVTVSITPALGLLSAGSVKKPGPANGLLLIGNPLSPVEQYPNLAFAGQEMTAIQNSLPEFRKVVFEGARAQPQCYARANPGRFALIHFVAHAAANPEEPLESAVILSRSGTNYKLRARDVLRTPLEASLVTISACQSAGARTYAGEGLVGFSWAFLEAGARNVIAGLWDVDDRSTADLMAHLYAGLARGLPPAEALRAAKLRMIESPNAYRKPYYWAPFEVFTREF